MSENGGGREIAKSDARPSIMKSILTEGRRDDIARALPGTIDPDVFIQAALTALAKDPNLQETTVESFFIACLESARLGLMPDGVQGAIIPYKGKAEFQPMVQGIAALISRAPKVRGSPTVEAVHEGDDFDWWRDEEGDHVKHRPALAAGRDSRKVTHVYSVIRFGDGSPPSVEVMDRSQVEKARAQSRAPNSDAWQKFYAEMAKKTCLKRHSKRVDKTPELQAAVEKDHALETGEGPTRLADLDARLSEESISEMLERRLSEETEGLKRRLAASTGREVRSGDEPDAGGGDGRPAAQADAEEPSGAPELTDEEIAAAEDAVRESGEPTPEERERRERAKRGNMIAVIESAAVEGEIGEDELWDAVEKLYGGNEDLTRTPDGKVVWRELDYGRLRNLAVELGILSEEQEEEGDSDGS